MKKVLLLVGLFCLLFILFAPVLISAASNPTPGPLVQCGNDANGNGKLDDNELCTIDDFLKMIGRVYNFIVWNIATPLAILAVLISGIMILISAGNPKWLQIGKDILKVAVWGLVLVFSAYLIINTILLAIGAAPLK